MSQTLEQGIAAASTTRISTDLEQLWRSQFFAQRGSTPAQSLAQIEAVEPQGRLLQSTNIASSAGGFYDDTIIKFYEDIIIELQRQVERYKTLWASTRQTAEADAHESYAPRETVRLSAALAKKLKSSTKPPLRIPAE